MLEAVDQLPECPRCGTSRFRRASMFDAPLEHPEQTHEFAPPEPAPARIDRVEQVREGVQQPGRYLVCLDEDQTEVFELAHGWNRIGRSANADVRLDDPTVSRRHALLVWEEDEPLRVLDDRSLNGVFLNGDLVEWGSLSDGDELSIGRYRLFLLEV
jgi:pSer/pThr/pTyr-binding forkhead associated (FHA) protein